MTRKKWNRLRKQRPELFKAFRDTSWEAQDSPTLRNLRCMAKRDVIAALTAFALKDDL